MIFDFIDLVVDIRNLLISVFPFLGEKQQRLDFNKYHLLDDIEIYSFETLIVEVRKELSNIGRSQSVDKISFSFVGTKKGLQYWDIAFYDINNKFISGISRKTSTIIPSNLYNSYCNLSAINHNLF